MAKIFVGFSFGGGFVAATTKIGLGRLVGVSVDTVRRALADKGDGMPYRCARSSSKRTGDGTMWYIAEVELVKIEARENRSSGFRGFKGNDGLLRELFKGTEESKGFKAIKI